MSSSRSPILVLGGAGFWNLNFTTAHILAPSRRMVFDDHSSIMRRAIFENFVSSKDRVARDRPAKIQPITGKIMNHSRYLAKGVSEL